MKRYIPLLALAGLLLNMPALAAQSLLERAKSGEPVRIGFANEAPYSFTSVDGQFVGSDIALIEAVFKKMGIVKIEGVNTQFGSLIPGLKAGRFDLASSGIYINPDRCKQVVFSEPNFAVGAALLVKSGNPKNLHSLEDVAKDASVVLAYTTGGGAMAEQARKLGVKPEQMVPLPDQPAYIAAIKSGRVDAVLNPALTIQTIVNTAKDPQIERAAPFTQPVIDGKEALGYGGFAFRPEDKDFVDEFNRYMAEIVASPTYVEMIKDYGFTAEELPHDITTAQICGQK